MPVFSSNACTARTVSTSMDPMPTKASPLALLSGSGFLIQVFDRLANDDPGFDPSGLLTFQLIVLEDRYAEDLKSFGH